MTHNGKTLRESLIADVKKAAILGLKGLLKEGEKLIQEGQVSIDTYLAQKTTGLDAYILHEQSVRNLTFVSGEVFIALEGEDDFIFGVDLYFTDANQKWTKSAHADAPKPLGLYFLTADQVRIRAEKKIEHTYDAPSI